MLLPYTAAFGLIMVESDPSKTKPLSLSRYTYLSLAWVFLGLGVLGAFLPLLPTTVFIILAAWAFAKSSPEREAWLLNHKTFGPPLRNWRKYGAISSRAKMMAYSLIILSGLISAWMLQARPLIMAMTLLCLSAVIVYIQRIPKLPDHLE